MSDDKKVQPDEDQVKANQLEKTDLSDQYIYDQALVISQAAQKEGIILRLIGATAFINHCPKYNHLYEKSNRRLTDVDFMTYKKTPQNKLDGLFNALGYEPIRALGWHSENRDIYVNDQKLYVDIFRDVLSYCHPISFIGRLELDFPTISLVDLVLEKLQILEINFKDLFDVVVVLLEHDFGSNDPEKIDLDRIVGLWSKDWGFFHTGTTNLKKIRVFVEDLDIIDAKEKKDVKAKIDLMLQRIEEAPKTLGWKIRAKIGTRVRWYQHVESVER